MPHNAGCILPRSRKIVGEHAHPAVSSGQLKSAFCGACAEASAAPAVDARNVRVTVGAAPDSSGQLMTPGCPTPNESTNWISARTLPGFVTTRHVVEQIEKILKPKHKFEYWSSDAEFYKVAAKTPRSNCVMDVSKLVAAGVKIRGVEEALEDSLRNWKPEVTK